MARCWATLGGARIRPTAADWLWLVPLAVRLGVVGRRPYWDGVVPGGGLDAAQAAKLDRVCRKLGLRAGQRLLDVGCGWGSLLGFAAERYGVIATGITLWAEQRDFVSRRMAEVGLGYRVEVRIQDYRQLAGERFDVVASIEMGEHVGERNYARYAAALHDAVEPGGRVVVQQMSRSGAVPGGGPFIESYIAPDMTMRPVDETVAYLQSAGLDVEDVEPMAPHYVRTIGAWAETLERRWDEVVEQVGVGWARVWRLYLAGGALAFRDGRMGVEQITAARPVSSGAASRADHRLEEGSSV